MLVERVNKKQLFETFCDPLDGRGQPVRLHFVNFAKNSSKNHFGWKVGVGTPSVELLIAGLGLQSKCWIDHYCVAWFRILGRILDPGLDWSGHSGVNTCAKALRVTHTQIDPGYTARRTEKFCSSDVKFCGCKITSRDTEGLKCLFMSQDFRPRG